LEEEERIKKMEADRIILEAENSIREANMRLEKNKIRSKEMFKNIKIHGEYNKLFELYNISTVETPEALTQMAELLSKIEDNKITVEKLIARRKRLDKQILEKTGNRGITEYTAITSLYDVKKIKKYLRSEALEYDSDETGTVSPGDSSDEDMPKVTQVVSKSGDPDTRVEPFMSYISRLRKRATDGNEKLYINFQKLEMKIQEMVEVQKTLQKEYSLHKQLFDKKYTEPLKETKAIIAEYHDELEKVKKFLSRGTLMIDDGTKRQNQSNELMKLKQDLEDKIKEFDKLKNSLNSVEKKLKEEKEKHEKTKEKKEEKLKKVKEKTKTKIKDLEEEIKSKLQEDFDKKEADLTNEIEVKFKNATNIKEAQWDEEKRDIRDALVRPLMQRTLELEMDKITLEAKYDKVCNKQLANEVQIIEGLKDAKKMGFDEAKLLFVKECQDMETQTLTTITEGEYEKQIEEYQQKVKKSNEAMQIIQESIVSGETYKERKDKIQKIAEVLIDIPIPVPPTYEFNQPNDNLAEKLLKIVQDTLYKCAELRKIEEAAEALKEGQKKLNNDAQEFAKAEQLKFKTTDKSMQDIALTLSNLHQSNYNMGNFKFFSYHIRDWRLRFEQTFACSKFVYIDITKIDLENSKQLFTLLCYINKKTGSKSHLWYGNELNRKINKKDHFSAYGTEKLLQRAQDTFMGWLDKSAWKGFRELEGNIMTPDSKAYNDLLRSIGNTRTARMLNSRAYMSGKVNVEGDVLQPSLVNQT
jgi:hypothetical protein